MEEILQEYNFWVFKKLDTGTTIPIGTTYYTIHKGKKFTLEEAAGHDTSVQRNPSGASEFKIPYDKNLDYWVLDVDASKEVRNQLIDQGESRAFVTDGAFRYRITRFGETAELLIDTAGNRHRNRYSWLDQSHSNSMRKRFYVKDGFVDMNDDQKEVFRSVMNLKPKDDREIDHLIDLSDKVREKVLIR